MQLTLDSIEIQGVLETVRNNTGKFTEINYKCGNENNIFIVTNAIRQHFISKNYIKDEKVNNAFDKQIEDIVLFLSINTKYKTPLQLMNYEHLTDIMPQLSKCLFANIVYDLDLCKYYCKVIEKLPLPYGIELLKEIIQCLKKSVPNIRLRYAIMFLRVSAIKLSSKDIGQQDEDYIDQLVDVTDIILQLLMGLFTVNEGKLTQDQMRHMGYILISLFELLLFCDGENCNMKEFINNVMTSCGTVVENTTVNVFCLWAEIKEDHEPLQNIIAGKAYEVVEVYKKYEDIKILVSMVRSIARKPKTLSEQVKTAPMEVVIKKIYENDLNQKTWFQALLDHKILENENAWKCIETWSHLCDECNVTKLLNLSRKAKNEKAIEVAIKCAALLNVNKLRVVMEKYFSENKFNGLTSDVESVVLQLRSIFNKMNNQTQIDANFIKEMCLLMLQSPDTVLKGVYEECLRNKWYTSCYKNFFVYIKEILMINDFGIDILREIISTNEPNIINRENYKAVFSTFLGMKYLSTEQIINLLFPLLNKFLLEKTFNQLQIVLQIFLECSLMIPATSEMTKVRWTLLNILNYCRCTFLEMSLVKQEVVQCVVEVIQKLCELHKKYKFEEECLGLPEFTKPADEYTKFYIKQLSFTTNMSLFQTLCKKFCPEKYTASRMLMFLPCAVTSEWIHFSEEIWFEDEEPVELLTDVMILLAAVVQSQDRTSDTGRQVFISFMYCLQQYGTIIQNHLLNSTLETEVNISKNICRLLKYALKPIGVEQLMSTINIIPPRSCEALLHDRASNCLLISIGSPLIAKLIVDKSTQL